MEGSTDLAPIDAELAGLRSEMGDPRSSYWRDPGRQSRYSELLAAKESGSAPATPSAAAQERADLKRQMADPTSAYWKDPALQARYGELVAAEEAEAAKPAPADGSRTLTLTEWRKAGHDEAHYPTYLAATSATLDVLQRLSAEDGGALSKSFEALPQPAQAGALAALLDRRAVAAEPVTEAALEALGADLPALAKEWGSASRQKLGRAMARVWRAVDAIEDEPARALLRWFGNLPAAHATAVLRRLAG